MYRVPLVPVQLFVKRVSLIGCFIIEVAQHFALQAPGIQVKFVIVLS